VYLADMICMMLGFGTGVDGLAYRFYSEVLDRMKLTEKDLRNVILDTSQRRQKIDELLSLV
ncbi:MAG: HDOD domain-containing protein, partial [Desulfobacterales bacterium]